MFIRTKDGIYEVEKLNLNKIVGNIKYEIIDDKLFKTMYGYEAHLYKYEILHQADTIEELCDEFVFNSDVSSYVVDKKHIEYVKETILKIYKENDETDYVKAMHPKLYGAVWTDKGLIYVAKMDSEGELVLI